MERHPPIQIYPVDFESVYHKEMGLEVMLG